MSVTPPTPLLRIPAEVRALLAGDALQADLEHVIGEARDAWRAGSAPFALGPAGTAARAVLDYLAARCMPEPDPAPTGSPALALVATERHQQLTRYSARHDDRMTAEELRHMAFWWSEPDATWIEWPWDVEEEDLPQRKDDRVDDLVRAAALLIAEADRLIRARERARERT